MSWTILILPFVGQQKLLLLHVYPWSHPLLHVFALSESTAAVFMLHAVTKSRIREISLSDQVLPTVSFEPDARKFEVAGDTLEAPEHACRHSSLVLNKFSFPPQPWKYKGWQTSKSIVA